MFGFDRTIAQSIARVVGATKRCDGYLKGSDWFISWCVEDLVELPQPEAYDEKYKKWTKDSLPIFPVNWKHEVSPFTKKQFGITKKLMARSNAERLICARDAGREGNLIFCLIYDQSHCHKSIERL